MNTFKILFEDGNEIITEMNANLEQAEEYYKGQYFNFGIEGDKMVKAIAVVELERV